MVSRRLKIGLTVLGVSALLMLAVEAGLRIFVNYDSQWNIRIGAIREFDPVTQFRNKPHHRFRNGATTNERGYFAPENLAFAKPADRLRIVYMGDSVTFLPSGNNYPRQVEELLAERGYPVETLNSAVPGFASQQVLAFFDEISQFDADVFVLSVGWNDLGQYGPEGLPYKRYEAGYEVSTAQRLLAGIYTIRIAYALQRYVRHADPAFDAPLDERDSALYAAYYPDHFVENVRSILSRAQARYSRVFVTNLATVTSPDPTPSQLERAHFPVGMDKNMRKLHRIVLVYNQAVEHVARELGVPVIDFHSPFQRPENRALLTDSCHVNTAGARVMAELVVASIGPTLPPPAAFTAR